MTSTAMLIQKGEAYLMEEVFEPAIKYLTEAIVSDANSARALCSRAEAYYRKALACGGNSGRAKQIRSELLNFALVDIKRAVQLAPDYSEAYSGLGSIYFEMREYQKAIAVYGLALKIAPNNSDYCYNQAMAYVRLKDWDNALSLLTVIIGLEQDNAEAFFERATVYDAMGKHDKALLDLDSAISLNPRAKYYAYRAESALDFGCDACASKSALSDLTEAIRLDPKDSQSFLVRSIIHAGLEDYESELSDLNVAVKLSPLSAEAYLNRYNCLKNLGDHVKAMPDWIVYCAIMSQEVPAGNPIIAPELLNAVKRSARN